LRNLHNMTRLVGVEGTMNQPTTRFADMNERARNRARARARGVARNARTLVAHSSGLPVGVLGALTLLAETIDELAEQSERQERR
jgi:hypothetical protein